MSTKKVIQQNYLDFLYETYMKGIDIGEENMLLLHEKGLLKDQTKQREAPIFKDKINETLMGIATHENVDIDAIVDIIEDDKKPDILYDIITDQELEERRQKYNHRFEGRKTPIQKIEWMPESTLEHSIEFVQWINSINHPDGFNRRTNYRKFTLYCQQAYIWLQENLTPQDFEEDEREDYMRSELERCDENSLYFLNKYIYYKEGDADGGRLKYVAREAHEIMCYMEDCGYSKAMAKGRQIAATTTLMALDVKDVIFKTNHFMKFITEDVEKAQEIFDDKLKFPFSQLPEWMRPNVLNERDNLFKVGYKTEKGVKEGVGSKIMVTAPKRTAIAGGAPQKVKIDEAANIKLLGQMIDNARPTMMWFNPKTKKIEIKRVLTFWATGGNDQGGGKAFETEYMAILTKWLEGKYESAIVPIFFNWRWRPGATQKDYDREKAVAYAKQGTVDGEKAITEFHQSWPEYLSDVFRTSAKTLIPDDVIEGALNRIRDEEKKLKFQLIQYGYFEPVYDFNSPAGEGSDVPFKIIDADFIPTEDLDPRASTAIFMHPEEGYINRYYQGTDPIDTDTGLSYFAATIWDKKHKTTSAILNWRTRDYHDAFLQSILLSLYYDRSPVGQKKGVKDLLEANKGTGYREYVKNKGFDDHFVLNYELPFQYQNKTTVNEGVGFDTKGLRKTMLVNKSFEVLTAYGNNIWHKVIFEQLKTFTCKITDTGKETWGPINKKYFRDDTIDSTTFSYICAEMCGYPEPINKSSEIKNSKVEYQLVRGSDLKLKRTAIRKRA